MKQINKELIENSNKKKLKLKKDLMRYKAFSLDIILSLENKMDKALESGDTNKINEYHERINRVKETIKKYDKKVKDYDKSIEDLKTIENLLNGEKCHE